MKQIRTTVDRSGMVVFDALPMTVATFTDSGILGSVGGSNRFNVKEYSSNMSSAVKTILNNDIRTNMVLSNLAGVMTNTTFETSTLSSALDTTNLSIASTNAALESSVGSTNQLIGQVITVINSIIGVVNNHNTLLGDVVNILNRKSLYPGQSFSDFKMALVMPAFHIDSIMYALQQFNGLQNACDQGELPNYLLTADLKFQIDLLQDILIPDFQNSAAAAAASAASNSPPA